MKFAQIFDGTIVAGASQRVSFSADNIQGLVCKIDTANPEWDDLFLSVNVGATFNVARCEMKQMQHITAFNQGALAYSGQHDAQFIDLGSVWLGTNEELEIIFDNENVADYDISISVCYDGDEAEDLICYQKLVDPNWSRENVEQVWLFGEDLSELNETITIQTASSSQTTKVEVFNHYTNTQHNSDTYHNEYAQVYDDADDILQKVTCTISDFTNVTNWIVVTNETDPDRQAEKNEEYVMKKQAKLSALNPKTIILNRLKGRL